MMPIAKRPLSGRSEERERPIAKQWEDEVFVSEASLSDVATHFTFPRLRRRPFPLPPLGRIGACGALLLSLALAACAPVSDYRPTVDLAGIDPARFEDDLHDCQKVAARDRYGPVLAGVVIGASIGVGLGSIAGGYAGNIGLGQSYGAIIGSVIGAAAGDAMTRGEPPPSEAQQVETCLRNNGYGVAPATVSH
jgi:outer membrane lipoprotein SlyB